MSRARSIIEAVIQPDPDAMADFERTQYWTPARQASALAKHDVHTFDEPDESFYDQEYQRLKQAYIQSEVAAGISPEAAEKDWNEQEKSDDLRAWHHSHLQDLFQNDDIAGLTSDATGSIWVNPRRQWRNQPDTLAHELVHRGQTSRSGGFKAARDPAYDSHTKAYHEDPRELMAFAYQAAQGLLRQYKDKKTALHFLSHNEKNLAHNKKHNVRSWDSAWLDHVAYRVGSKALKRFLKYVAAYLEQAPGN